MESSICPNCLTGTLEALGEDAGHYVCNVCGVQSQVLHPLAAASWPVTPRTALQGIVAVLGVHSLQRFTVCRAIAPLTA